MYQEIQQCKSRGKRLLESKTRMQTTLLPQVKMKGSHFHQDVHIKKEPTQQLLMILTGTGCIQAILLTKPKIKYGALKL